MRFCDLPILAESLKWCIAEYTKKYSLKQRVWVHYPVHPVECFHLIVAQRERL